MTLLIINAIDFTSKVNQRSYSVQRKDVFTSWMDGNWITHREISRRRVEGSFTMTFKTETDYASFLSAIAAVKTTGGYCPIQLWINNEKTTDTINAFLEISTNHRWTTEAFGGNPELASVNVKVTER